MQDGASGREDGYLLGDLANQGIRPCLPDPSDPSGRKKREEGEW